MQIWMPDTFDGNIVLQTQVCHHSSLSGLGLVGGIWGCYFVGLYVGTGNKYTALGLFSRQFVRFGGSCGYRAVFEEDSAQSQQIHNLYCSNELGR